MINIPQILNLVVHTPMVEWDAVCNRWIAGGPGKGYLPTKSERGDMWEAIRSLDSVIVTLCRFRAYLDARYGHGCGDQGHAAGVKAQNKLAAKIRKALGFTYAKDDISFNGEGK